MNTRRLSPSGTQPAAPPVKAQINNSAWPREQQHQPAGEEPSDPVAGTKTQPAGPTSRAGACSRPSPDTG